MDKVDIKSLEHMRNEIIEKIDEYYRNEAREKIEQNKFYIGCCLKRTFHDKVVYYKIIQVDSKNQFSLYTFYFTDINNDYSKISTQELCGISKIKFFANTLNGELKPCKEIDLYDEISKQEYEDTLNKWIQNIYKI